MPNWWITKRSFSFDLDGCWEVRFATASTSFFLHRAELG